MLDHFQMGPNLVRGFADRRHRTARPDARHHAGRARRHDVLGHLVRSADPDLRPAEGLRHAASRSFADAGSVWDYQRPDQSSRRPDDRSRRSIRSPARTPTTMIVRSSVGAGIIWDSPFGPIRFDYAFPLTKDPNDRVSSCASAAARNSRCLVARTAPSAIGGMTEPLVLRSARNGPDRAGDRRADAAPSLRAGAALRAGASAASRRSTAPGRAISRSCRTRNMPRQFAATRAGICLDHRALRGTMRRRTSRCW